MKVGLMMRHIFGHTAAALWLETLVGARLNVHWRS